MIKVINIVALLIVSLIVIREIVCSVAASVRCPA